MFSIFSYFSEVLGLWLLKFEFKLSVNLHLS